MKTIHKYPIPYGTRNLGEGVRLPRGAQIIAVQMQRGLASIFAPQLWAVVDTDEPMEWRDIVVRGTGYAIDGEVGRHLGTFQDGPYVFHVFDLTAMQ